MGEALFLFTWSNIFANIQHHLLSTYYMMDISLDAEDTAAKKMDKLHALTEPHFSEESR